LASWLRAEARLWGIGKSNDADIYRLEKPGDWERVKCEVKDVYRERLFRMAEDGALVPAEEACADGAPTERR
jgi:hypothetical protein